MYGDEPTLPDTRFDLTPGLARELPGQLARERVPAPTAAPAGPVWAPRAPTFNAMAALSIVFAFLFFPLGIVFGHAAKRQIARTGETGAGLATTALVMAYLMLGLTVCLCCGGLYAFGPKSR